MLCIWCNTKHIEEGSLSKYCSHNCQSEKILVKGWCKRYNITFSMPKNQAVFEQYQRAVFVVHPWDTGDVNQFPDGMRERVKTLRCWGMTLREISLKVHISVESVRSILEGEV